MRKRFFLFSFLLISVFALAQESFTVEGKKVKTAFVTRTYNFSYSFKGDSVVLAPVDSQLTYQNKDFTVEYTLKSLASSKQPILNVGYIRKNGQDSVRRTYKNNVLTQQYLSRYDSYNRPVGYVVTDKENPTNDVDWTYHYQDRKTKTGRVSSKFFYKGYAKKLKSLEYRTDVYYDLKGDTIKIMKINSTGDSAQIFTKKKFTRSSGGFRAKPTVFRQETTFSEAEKKNIEKLITKQLVALRFKLKDPTVRYVENEYFAPDKTVNLVIKKTKDLRMATLTIFEFK